jgi:hypothetical protein
MTAGTLLCGLPHGGQGTTTLLLLPPCPWKDATCPWTVLTLPKTTQPPLKPTYSQALRAPPPTNKCHHCCTRPTLSTQPPKLPLWKPRIATRFCLRICPLQLLVYCMELILPPPNQSPTTYPIIHSTVAPDNISNLLPTACWSKLL